MQYYSNPVLECCCALGADELGLRIRRAQAVSVGPSAAETVEATQYVVLLCAIAIGAGILGDDFLHRPLILLLDSRKSAPTGEVNADQLLGDAHLVNDMSLLSDTRAEQDGR
jgi:hypothetical protein